MDISYGHSNIPQAPRTLVTGGDGFVGRALTTRLQQLGHRVLVIDNHSTSSPVHANDGIHRIEADIETFALHSVPRPDLIIHLASLAYPRRFKDSRTALFNTNVIATERLLKWGYGAGAKLMFMSTSEVYGLARQAKKEARGIREEDECSTRTLTSRSIYPMSKRMGEELVETYRRRGMWACSVRPFNIYGPEMDEGAGKDARVIPRFLNALEHNQPLPICGDGQQVRSFVWMEDVVNALCLLINHSDEPPSVVNLGRDEPVTIGELAERICSLAGMPTKQQWLKAREDEPRWRRPNTHRLEELTGWKASVPLHTGLRELLKNRGLLKTTPTQQKFSPLHSTKNTTH